MSDETSDRTRIGQRAPVVKRSHGIAIALEFDARRKRLRAADPRLFVAAVGVLAAGFVIWSLDITRTVCAPTSWLQGHAVWQVATAVSAWLVFLYYDERA
jgi:hypothetical protein